VWRKALQREKRKSNIGGNVKTRQRKYPAWAPKIAAAISALCAYGALNGAP